MKPKKPIVALLPPMARIYSLLTIFEICASAVHTHNEKKRMIKNKKEEN